ncbi:MAG TPA: phosphoenolpyruvate--protein phosphotransferase [Solirubrobacteraceae bacterium]|nr:phosphoenolpyruvate--protein phosphotransferase [Solirubrobacteraceae bacterium]
MVGIVVVSHSDTLAEGVVRLAREMASDQLALEAAGGTSQPGVLGTDAERVRAAIERAMSPDGVLVLMDLGSALMSAELAAELLTDAAGPVKLTSAPLVEGTVAAAVAASGGASLEEVAAEARGALAMKLTQIGDEAGPAPGPAGPGAGETPAADAGAELYVGNAIGLHARPAARFVELVRGFDAEVRVAKAGSGIAPVKASSLTNLVALGARLGDTLTVSARGPQAQEAVNALRALAAGGFGDGLTAGGFGDGLAAGGRGAAQATTHPQARTGQAPSQPGPQARADPPAHGTVLTGVAASAGIAIGLSHRLGGELAPPPEDPAGDPEAERARLDRARAQARAAIERDRAVIAGRAGQAEAEIFDAHLALLDDEALLEPAVASIGGGASAAHAWYQAVNQAADIYRRLEDPLLRERATDVLDVGRRVLGALTGSSSEIEQLSGVVIADELTPADTAALDPQRVLAIATARGSNTAHAAILARSVGLPAVVGLGPEILAVGDGTQLLLDGRAGTVLIDPSTEAVTAAREQRQREREHAREAQAQAHKRATTRDGVRIEVAANIGSIADATRAVECGAEGVGLLRTEFLFMDREDLPSEDEQTRTLEAIARTLDGRPLVVRTLDAGADKPLAALPMPAEANPFLGMRGVRLALQYPELLATQFRAVLRVAAAHPVRVMLPMVATLAEVLAARELLDQARADTGIDAPLEFGLMVEVPAAALDAARLAEHVDFFSLGTNDLTQYTMAAERGDARLAPLLASPQPAVLRLIRDTVAGAAAHGRWTGVCGEMAGDPVAAILLAGLGVTELSMAPALIPEVKAALRRVDLTAASRVAERALEAVDAQAARALVADLL